MSSWTGQRVDVLKKMWAEGHSCTKIAKQLGGVTRNAVIGKVHRLGLSGRATPSRPVKRPSRLARAKPSKPATVETDKAARSKRSEQRAILEALTPAKDVDGGAITLLTLRDSMCKWPIGDPADANFAFCGRKSDCGPYCAEHARLGIQSGSATARSQKQAEYIAAAAR